MENGQLTILVLPTAIICIVHCQFSIVNSVGHLHHGKADDLIAQLEALLEDLTDGIFCDRVVFCVHDSVMDVGIEGVTYVAEDLHAKTGENAHQLIHGHLHAFFVGFILGGLIQCPL